MVSINLIHTRYGGGLGWKGIRWGTLVGKIQGELRWENVHLILTRYGGALGWGTIHLIITRYGGALGLGTIHLFHTRIQWGPCVGDYTLRSYPHTVGL